MTCFDQFVKRSWTGGWIFQKPLLVPKASPYHSTTRDVDFLFLLLFCRSCLALKPSYLSTWNENTIPKAYIIRKSVVKPPNECRVFTHRTKWKERSSEEEKLHYKFSDGKQASFRDPGRSFLPGACCQRRVRGADYSSAAWHAWERLHHHLLWGARQKPIPINIRNRVQLNFSFILS